MNSFFETNCILVPKTKIAENGDYNLTGDRYRETVDYSNAKWPMVELGVVCDVQRGTSITKKDLTAGEIPVIAGGQQPAYYHNQANRTGKTITVSASGAYAGFVNYFETPIFASDCSTMQSLDEKKILTNFVFNILKVKQQEIYKLQSGMGQPHVYAKDLKQIKIPLPPLEVQEQIVAEIEQYQKVINGAKQVVENWKPSFRIDPSWEMVELGEVCEFVRGPFGGSLKKEIFVKEGYAVYEQSHAIYSDFTDFRYFINSSKYEEMKRFNVEPFDLIMSCSGTMGKTAIVPQNAPKGIINQALLKLSTRNNLDVKFLKLWMDSESFQNIIFSNVGGAAIQNVASVKVLSALKIPLPPFSVQEQIVAEIEAEQRVVNANKELIEKMQKKIEAKIGEVWGEEV